MVRGAGDPLRRAVGNLLGNAVNHGTKDEPITVNGQIEDGILSLSVTNGGTPIPDSALPDLFRLKSPHSLPRAPWAWALWPG